MSKSTSIRQLFKNALFNSGGWGLNVFIVLLVTPFFVKKLTLEGYGIYALILGLTGYYELLDLGLSSGVTKYVARFHSEKNNPALHKTINGALAVQATLGSIGSLLLVISAEKIIDLLKISGEFYYPAKYALYICSFGFLCQMFASTLSSVLCGLQRYDLTAKIATGTNSIYHLIGVFLLYRGYGFLGLVIWKVFMVFVSLLILMGAVKRQIGEMGFGYGISSRYYKLLFNFSGYLFISQISGLFTKYIIRFVIGFYLGPSAVTFYIVPRKIIEAVGGFLNNAADVLFPYASELQTRNQIQQIKSVYKNASKILASISIPIFLTIIVFSKHILSIWMGKNFAADNWIILSIIGGTALLSYLSTVPSNMAIGLGYTKVKCIFSLVEIVLFLALLPLFTIKWGILGAVTSIFVAYNLPDLTFIAYTTGKIIRLSIKKYIIDVLGIHILPMLFSIVLVPFISSQSTTYWIILVSVLSLLLYMSFIAFFQRAVLAKIKTLIQT